MPLPSTSPADGTTILIAGQSGRALAAAARRAGYVPYVADLFADEDTLALAADYRRLRGRFGVGLDEGDVLPALERLASTAKGPIAGLVLGSGFERNPNLIATLERTFRVIGASSKAVRRLKDPYEFAALLGLPRRSASAGVSHAERWNLAVQAAGRFGRGSYPCRARCPAPPRTLCPEMRQRRTPCGSLPGRWAPGADHHNHEAMDLALAPRAVALWRGDRAGGWQRSVLPKTVDAALEAAIAAIVDETGLRGLASADLLVDGDDWWLLEINPRPGATLDILDRRPTPLLRSHAEASAGQMGTLEDLPAEAAGSMILYAARAIPSVGTMAWPDYVSDKPRQGTRIAPGAPICTIGAVGADESTVKSMLEARGIDVLRLLDNRDCPRDWHAEAAERQRARRAAP